MTITEKMAWAIFGVCISENPEDMAFVCEKDNPLGKMIRLNLATAAWDDGEFHDDLGEPLKIISLETLTTGGEDA